MNTSSACWFVQMELAQVQTFLFAVPELKSMIGANALLGEVLRGRLMRDGCFARLMTGNDAATANDAIAADNLPGLAVQKGAFLPVDASNLALPSQPRDDPLMGPDYDNPAASYQQGVLVRDGGHLHAVFRTKSEAEEFLQSACSLVGQRLPGLLVSAKTSRLAWNGDQWIGEEQDAIQSHQENLAQEIVADQLGECVADLPQFQVCEVTGQGPAAERGKRGEEDGWISSIVTSRRLAAERFDDGRSGDMLGLLRKPLIAALGLDDVIGDKKNLFPNDFKEIAPSGYLAVLAADGNGIGIRSSAWRAGVSSQDFFLREARGERFFHSMRVAVRRALLAALRQTYGHLAERTRHRESSRLPFRLMMLGGDDLLLVCDAGHALRLAQNYVEQLGDATNRLADGLCLDVGVGVAIVKKTFPFHRAHALAEQLQGSAKRLFRSQPHSGSTVDWLSISEAWHDDIASVRQRDFTRAYAVDVAGTQLETLALSQKPYFVLGDGHSLEALLVGAGKATKHVPRGQLIALVHSLKEGRRQADWSLRLLDPEIRQALQPALHGASMWKGVGKQQWATDVLDFLELFELERLRQQQEGATPADSTRGQ